MIVAKQAKVTSKGQVTIPIEVRNALGLHEGDTVRFEVDDSGRAVLEPVRKKGAFAKYAGALREGTSLTAKEIVKELRKERGW
jgi:antitoxin PrlF